LQVGIYKTKISISLAEAAIASVKERVSLMKDVIASTKDVFS